MGKQKTTGPATDHANVPTSPSPPLQGGHDGAGAAPDETQTDQANAGDPEPPQGSSGEQDEQAKQAAQEPQQARDPELPPEEQMREQERAQASAPALPGRTYLYRHDCPNGKVFEGDDVRKALDDGWVDHPAKCRNPS